MRNVMAHAGDSSRATCGVIGSAARYRGLFDGRLALEDWLLWQPGIRLRKLHLREHEPQTVADLLLHPLELVAVQAGMQQLPQRDLTDLEVERRTWSISAG